MDNAEQAGRVCPGTGQAPTRINRPVRFPAVDFGECPRCGGSYRLDDDGLLMRHPPLHD
jgi:hypothetical protein